MYEITDVDPTMSHLPDHEPLEPLSMTELLGALDMPRSGLRAWFGQLQRFCLGHGGRRYYADVMDLVGACQEHLDHGDGSHGDEGG